MKHWRYILSITTMALALPFIAAPAGAGDCAGYSREAARDARQNRDLGCGGSGARWNTDPRGHYKWCLSASQSQLDQERSARRSLLSRCKRNEDRCAPYSRRAAALARAARDMGCGYSGARWNTDPRGHYSWCKSVSRSEADREQAARESGVNRCRAGRGGRGGRVAPPPPPREPRFDCKYYAQLAVDQTREAKRNRCGFNWSSSRREHRRWCRGVSPYTAHDMLERRQAKLNRCRHRRPGGFSCHYYARMASEQAARARRAGCSFRWKTDYRRHLSWCRGVSEHRAKNMLAERSRKLNRCLHLRHGRYDCKHFADQAVRQAMWAASMRCGFPWHSNRDSYLRWCRHSTPAKAQLMLDRRGEKLNACRYGR